MKLSEMLEAINSRVDDVVDTITAVAWLNAGKDQMAIAVGAKFPDLDPTNLNDTFVFDDKFHECPVLYACACYKEADSALSEVANFMAKFENLKKEFVGRYTVPPRYRDDRLSQQFVAQAGQTKFQITKAGYNPTYGDLLIYVNDLECPHVIVNDDKSFEFDTTQCTINEGDCITAVWEEHQDLIEPPYNWWRW